MYGEMGAAGHVAASHEKNRYGDGAVFAVQPNDIAVAEIKHDRLLLLQGFLQGGKPVADPGCFFKIKLLRRSGHAFLKQLYELPVSPHKEKLDFADDGAVFLPVDEPAARRRA